jgi:AraC-like DNA-binding protein
LGSGRPYSISFAGPDAFEHVIYQVPRASLDARSNIGAATALRIPAASNAGQLASPHLRTLARLAPSGHRLVPGPPFIDAWLDLALNALRTAAGYTDQANLRRALAGDLKDHALARLSDRGLSPEAVAGVGYISVRQLHRLFARDGLTFGRWVREHRLRRCRDDLADQRLSHLTIAKIAARWGFRSAAHLYPRLPGAVRHHARRSPPFLPGWSRGLSTWSQCRSRQRPSCAMRPITRCPRGRSRRWRQDKPGGFAVTGIHRACSRRQMRWAASRWDTLRRKHDARPWRRPASGKPRGTPSPRTSAGDEAGVQLGRANGGPPDSSAASH